MLINHLDLFTKIAVNTATILAGIWAIYTYKKSKRSDATKRIFDLYNSFYTNEKYFWARDTFEYEYATIVAPLLEKRVLDRNIKLSKDEIEQLRQLDLIFNFFEHLLYLEEQHILEKSDREVFFEYWFDFFLFPERGGLRRYFAKCGYERLASWTHSGKNEFIALSESQLDVIGSNVEKLANTHLGWDYFEKYIEDSLPVENNNYKIFKIEDLTFIKELDKLLGFDPRHREKSRLVRTNLRMKMNKIDCWLFL